LVLSGNSPSVPLAHLPEAGSCLTRTVSAENRSHPSRRESTRSSVRADTSTFRPRRYLDGHRLLGTRVGAAVAFN